MHFVLPTSLLPDNKDLDFWLHQETKTAQQSPVAEVKKHLPTDNLSTWLSTRYAANLTKKSSSSETSKASTVNLDMWLAEKRRKLDNDAANDEEISKWLHPETPQDKRKRSAIDESMSTLTLEEIPPQQARLCPALGNWQAQADMPLDAWLKNNSATNANQGMNKDCGDEWLSVAATEAKSGFVYPEDSLPVQSWLAQPPPTPLDEGIQRLGLEQSNQSSVESWIQDSQEQFAVDDKEEVDDEMSQWLLVEGQGGRTRADSLATDEGSSIVVLDSAVADDDSKSVASSSWKFW